MSLRRLLAFGGLALAALQVPAFAQQNPSPLDGNWIGRTSQKRPITFRVEAGSMRVLEIDWAMRFDQICPGREGSSPGMSRFERAEMFYFYPRTRGYEPPPIGFPAFTVSREVETPAAPVTILLNGSFASDSSVSGELTLTANGCVGRETFTWQADRRTGR
jgi:hypothetical protein